MSNAPSALAIIGGGRWGQVYLSILAALKTPFDQVVVVSKANAVQISATIAKLNLNAYVPLATVRTLHDLFANYNVKAAIIANAASQHFATARQLINHGVHVLIEKPIVQTIEEMNILISESRRHHVCLVPGLNFRFSSYIKNFALEIAKRGTPKSFSFEWFHKINEVRHGRMCTHDSSITVAQDAMPHVWTILFEIFCHSSANAQPHIKIHDYRQDVNHAVIKLSINANEGTIVLKRTEEARKRLIAMQFAAETITLDFTTEPGDIIINSNASSADPKWQQRPGPLTLQLEHFFNVIAYGQPMADDLAYCLNTVAHTSALTTTCVG